MKARNSSPTSRQSYWNRSYSCWYFPPPKTIGSRIFAESCRSTTKHGGLSSRPSRSSALADSAALLSAMNEIQRLKQQLNHMKSEAAQSTIENLEIHNNCIVSETQKQLEMANDTIETLHADSRNLLESLISVNSKLEQSKVRVGALEEIAAEYQGVVDDKEAERRNAHWNECGASELESIQIRSACEAAEFAKLRESELELTIERTRIELSELKERLLSKERESKELREEMEKGEDRRFDSELKLMKATTDVTELKADLLEKEAALQSILEENRILNSELSKRGHEHQIKYAAAIADAEKARAAEKEALTRTSLAEAKAANLEMEAELRRLKVQSDQWRKAAEAASAILAPGNNGSRIMEDSDGNSVSGRLTSSPSADDASPKKNSSILRKLGGLWKKSPKSFNYRKQAEEDEHVLQGFGNF